MDVQDDADTLEDRMGKQDTLQLACRGISRRTVLRWAGLTFVDLAGSSLVLLGCAQQPAGPAIHASPTSLSGSKALYTYRGHSDYVEAVAWSPDGKRIVSGSADKTVQVWDAINGGHVFTYRGHSDGVNAVAWSPDGRRIASGDGTANVSRVTTVQVWDVADGGHVFTYRGHSLELRAVAWSPDGRRIASGSGDKTVQMWDAADGGHVFTYRGHSDRVHGVAWSPDGKRIASASEDKTVQVWMAM